MQSHILRTKGLLALALICASALTPPLTAADLVLFEGQADIGATKHAGSAGFNAVSRVYTVTGGGANMWFTNDAFHFVWKQVSGDVTLAADITFEGKGVDPHRKVITFVGSFTDIRGEYIYPELVAESAKKPLRIFMQDGRNDNRRPGRPNGDWFLQNVRLMQALTKKCYEVNYAWGIGNHGQKQGGAIFPEMMRWLWRDQPVSTDPNDMVERSFRHPPARLTNQEPAATSR